MRILIVFMLTLFCAKANAQATSNMIADEIEIIGQTTVIARGNVEIWHDGRRLRANRLVFNQNTQVLKIDGPIEIKDNNGTQIFANDAQLGRDLRRGIVNGARLILQQRFEIKADEISLDGEAFTSASDVFATACDTCNGKIPTWHIKATSLRHDQGAQQIYLKNARFFLYSFPIPLFYLPTLRLPEPGVTRARGFLVPELSTNSILETGIKIPYFVPIDESRDLKITPYISPNTKTLEYRYRQAYKDGNLEVNGAFSHDTVHSSSDRNYIFGRRNFNLQNGYKLNMNVELVSDRSYLSDYSYSTNDRLHSFAQLTKTTPTHNTKLGLSFHTTLRDGEDNNTIPSLVLDGLYEQRLTFATLPGRLDYKLSFSSSYRQSSLDRDSDDEDSEVDGYDTARLSLHPSWYHSHLWGNGVIATTDMRVEMDTYFIGQHADFPNNVTNMTGLIGSKIAYPLHKRTKSGGLLMIEPAAQVVFVGSTDSDVPNQDATHIEFDYGNLFNLTRLPGQDVKEIGASLSMGVRGSYTLPSGLKLNGGLGRLFRQSDENSFSLSSGLKNKSSDWLVVMGFQAQNGIDLLSRTLLSNEGKINKSENRLNYLYSSGALNATHVWLPKDEEEGRSDAVSELQFTAKHGFSQNWAVSSNASYDFISKNFSKAAVGLNYRNECADIIFEISKRFSDSDTFRENTHFGIKVNFQGYNVSGIGRGSGKGC